MDTPVQIRIGADAKVYRNTNTYNSPTWIEVDIVRDATLNVSHKEWDASFRGGGGWEAMVATLKSASIDIDVLHQTQDAGYVALRQAWVTKDPIELLVMDGSKDVSGNEGLRATFQVFDFTSPQPLADGQTNKFSVKPTLAANPPTWYRVT